MSWSFTEHLKPNKDGVVHWRGHRFDAPLGIDIQVTRGLGTLYNEVRLVDCRTGNVLVNRGEAVAPSPLTE